MTEEESLDCMALQEFCANQGSLPQAVLYSTLGVAQTIYYGNLFSGYQGKIEEISEKMSGDGGMDSGILGREVEHFCEAIYPMVEKSIDLLCNPAFIPTPSPKSDSISAAQRIGSAQQAFMDTLNKGYIKCDLECDYSLERATLCAGGATASYMAEYDDESIRIHQGLQVRSLSGVTSSMRQLNTSAKGLTSCSLGIYDALAADAASGMNSGFAMIGAGLGEYQLYNAQN